jgi:protein translocase SecG subunit
MSIIAGILTAFLLANSLLLILLVLVQLPKKDAGAGLAFGSGAADALFGAGSGNALTKLTKWATVVFVVVAILIGWIQDHSHDNGANTANFLKAISQKGMQQQVPPAQPATTPQPSAQPANGVFSAAPVTTNQAAVTTNNPAK